MRCQRDTMKSVRDVMSRDPRTVGRNDRLALDAGKLTGVLSQRDLFHSALVRALGFGTAARDKVLDSLLIKNVMTKDVETTTPDTPLDSAAALMAQRKIGCLPVVENDALVGILTEGDFVRLVADEGR